MINVVQGQTKIIVIVLRGASSGNPLDLTGATEIAVSFPQTTPDGSFQQKLLSDSELSIQGDAKLGTIAIPVVEADTALWLVGQALTVQIQVKKSGDDKTYSGAILNVSAAPAPQV